ncbi:MAG: hypothetical protein WA667_09615 [Candidatus Nitrosopolaris sp.]
MKSKTTAFSIMTIVAAVVLFASGPMLGNQQALAYHHGYHHSYHHGYHHSYHHGHYRR